MDLKKPQSLNKVGLGSYCSRYSLAFIQGTYALITGELDSVFTMASLTQLEAAAEIPVLSELEAKSHEFQAIIRVKQHNASGAINKWLSAPVLSRIVPTWKNFLSVLRLIHLDDVAQQVEAYLSQHLMSIGEGKCACIYKSLATFI